jgi:hypothetical protein
MTEIVLPGLDGGTLLGFVGALGVLEALVSTRASGEAEPRLGWHPSSTWQPVFGGVPSVDHVVARILDDAKSKAVESVLSFRYVKMEKRGPKIVRSLAAPAAVFRDAISVCLSSRLDDAVRCLASLMCEPGRIDNEDKETGPSPEDFRHAGLSYDSRVPLSWLVNQTPFDFTSRNTQFLDQIDRIRDIIDADAVSADILRGQGAPCERIMRWDSLVDMPGALFSRAAPMTRPAAEWLIFRGISLFPLVADGGHATMPGFSGRRKAGELSWPLWTGMLPKDVVKTVLGVEWKVVAYEARLARGVPAAFVVSLGKDATGYDGVVSPARPLT